MREFRRLFRGSNIGVLIYGIINYLLLRRVWVLLCPAAAAAKMGNLTFLAAYLLGACLSMSALGEGICRLFLGARPVARQDWNRRLQPMTDEIRERVFREYQRDLASLRVYYVYDPLPSAFAVGQRTICVSTALMESSDEVIRAAIAQQAGRILNYDSMLTLFVTVGNGLALALLLICQAVRLIVTVVSFLVSRTFFGRFAAVLLAGLTWLPVLLLNVILSISYLIVNFSNRRKTYEADDAAVRLGYGVALILAIEEMEVADMAGRMNLWNILNRPHPGMHDRIGRIQERMAGREYAEGGFGGGNEEQTRNVINWLNGGREAASETPAGMRAQEPLAVRTERPAGEKVFRRL